MVTIKAPWGIAITLLLFAASCNHGMNNDRTMAEELVRTVSTDSVKKAAEPSPLNTEDYDPIVENQFLTASQNPLSTFSIDVDQAAYSNVRRYLEGGSLPPRGAVRIEEMINYFNYDYAQPQNDDPFAVHTESAPCPWNKEHLLVKIGLKGKEIATDNLPPANLVFLVDVSGSMAEANKLPLVQASLKLLTARLRPIDKISIVVYAGAAGLVLPSTPGNQKRKITEAIDGLDAGGSTAGAAGIRLAYQTAKENFIRNGNNRVILATDGDFNVGTSSDDELVSLIEAERKSNIYLTVLGFGVGNYKDNKMQLLADKGNGNHAYIDNLNEAKKVLIREFGSTLFTIAKDVKLQVEFNPQKVAAYRLIGYENRMLQKEDFVNDKKDAGELGAGHTVTALYEIIPAGVKDSFVTAVIPLKYQVTLAANNQATDEMMTIKLRYKKPGEETSKLILHTVPAENGSLETTTEDFRFAAAVAEFGMLLRHSGFKQNASYDQVISMAKAAKLVDEDGYRQEFIGLVETAALLDKNDSGGKH
jgi:Ca-activated chloride channel family protein